MKCLGLDIGSSSLKGAVLDIEQREITNMETRPFPEPMDGLPPQMFEVALPAIEQSAREIIDRLLAAAPDAKRLYCSGQMGGVVLVDPNGRPLSNYLSWRDQRSLARDSNGTTVLAAARNRLGEALFDDLGRELQPGSTTTLLYWLREHRSLPPHAVPISIGDYVLGALCESSPRMHVTHAIGMLNLDNFDWHDEAFERLGLEQIRLPELMRDVQCVGSFEQAGQRLACYGAFGDQQCALAGAGLLPGELSINVSTGSQVSRRTRHFVRGRFQTRAYFDNDRLQTITHLPAGRSLNVLVDLVTEITHAAGSPTPDPWRIINELTQATDRRTGNDDGLQVDLSFFSGPLGSTGSIRNITTNNLTVGQLFDAAFQAMADNYARCAAWLDPDQSWSQVVLSGTLARAGTRLHEYLAERFRVPIRESRSEETLLGLLELAATTPESAANLALSTSCRKPRHAV